MNDNELKKIAQEILIGTGFHLVLYKFYTIMGKPGKTGLSFSSIILT